MRYCPTEIGFLHVPEDSENPSCTCPLAGNHRLSTCDMWVSCTCEPPLVVLCFLLNAVALGDSGP